MVATNVGYMYGWTNGTPAAAILNQFLNRVRKQDFVLVKNYTIAAVSAHWY